MTTRLWARPRAVWGKTIFGPTILLKSPHVLLTKPWFELWPTLDILNSSQLLSLQCYNIVNLMILTIMSKSTIQTCTLQIYRPDLLPLNQRLRSLCNYGLQEFKISNLASFCMSILQSRWSTDTFPTWSMVLPSLRVFDHSTRINGPMTLSLINDWDLLWVFKLFESQISNPPSPKHFYLKAVISWCVSSWSTDRGLFQDFTWNTWVYASSPLDVAATNHFRTLLRVHGFTPSLP